MYVSEENNCILKQNLMNHKPYAKEGPEYPFWEYSRQSVL
jgi:hypothetical protein